MAQYYLEPEQFQVVDIPKNENFLKEYETRQKKGNTGRPLIIFRNANAEYLNEVIDLLPDVTLIEEKDKNYENANRFAEELFQALYQKGLLRKFYYTRDIAWVAKWGVAEEFERRYREGDEKKLYYKKGLLYYALANPNLKARYQIADFLLAKEPEQNLSRLNLMDRFITFFGNGNMIFHARFLCVINCFKAVQILIRQGKRTFYRLSAC